MNWLFRRLRGDQSRDHPSVAQHRRAIGDLQHLVDVVGDEDHAGAGSHHTADDVEQLIDVAARQERRRLVQHQ